MKKIYFILFLLLQTICLGNLKSNAQCTVSISGNTCVGSTLTANFSGGTLSKLEWVKIGKNGKEKIVGWADTSNFIITVAGGNGNGSHANQLYYPSSLFVDDIGNIYVADRANSRIQKWTPGALSGVTVATGDAASGVYVDKDGNIYVAEQYTNVVRKWAPGAAEGIVVAKGKEKAVGVWLHMSDIYVSDNFGNCVLKWKPGATKGKTVAGGYGEGSSPYQLAYPWGIYVDNDGNIYIADAGNNRIQKWAPGAKMGVTVAGGNGYGSAPNQLANPEGVYVDALGNIYVADEYNHRIQKWAPEATEGVTVAGGNGSGSALNQLDRPYGVNVDGNGNLYVVDFNNNRVQKYIPANGVINTQFTPIESGTYQVIATTAEGCTDTSDAVVIDEGPHIGNIIGETRDLCGGGTFTYTTKQIPGATYTWSVPANTTILSGQGTETISLSIPSDFINGEISVVANDGCNGNIFKDTLSTKPIRPLEITGPEIVEPNQTGLVYSTPAEAGVSYYWNVHTDAQIVSGQGTNSVTVNWGTEQGMIQVKAFKCGDSAHKGMHVKFNDNIANRTTIPSNKNIITPNKNSLSVYPNPATNTTTIKFTSTKGSKYTIEVTDFAGKVLQRINGISSSGENKISLDVSNYAGGMYFINLVDENGKRSLKLSKQ